MLSAPFNNITKTIHIDFNKNAQNVKITTRNMTFKDWGFNAENRFAKWPFPFHPLPAFLEWLDVSKSGLICDLYHSDSTNNFIKTLNISRFRPGFWCTFADMLYGLWHWLDNLTMLEHLDLSGNKIKTIPTGAFTQTKNLKHLYLCDNSLVTLTFEIKYLFNLKVIYLSDNLIQYVSSQFESEINSKD